MVPLSGSQFIPSHEVFITADGINRLDKDSHIHCHAVQTLSTAFLKGRRGRVDSVPMQNEVLVKIKAFLSVP